jgi:hypothetical protein
VQAVFSWSVRQLNPEAARMFRLTGATASSGEITPAVAVAISGGLGAIIAAVLAIIWSRGRMSFSSAMVRQRG